MEDHHQHNHKLKFKFKISRKDDDDQETFIGGAEPPIPNKDDDQDELEDGEIREEENDHNNNNNNNNNQTQLVIEPSSKKRSCPHCGREFINGKALGGHLRVHADNPSTPKPDTSGPNSARHHRCSMCHKKFSSRKGLFGHMRLHPERQYRGMQPYNNKVRLIDQGSGSGSDSGSGGSGLRGIIEGWKVKGKRGQKGRPLSSSSPPSSSCSGFDHRADEEEMVAVEVFCHFANHGVSEDSKKRKKKREEFDEDELYFLQDFFEFTTNSKMNPNPNPNNKKTVDDVNSVVKNKKNHFDDEEDEKVEKKWKCGSCNKTFLSHQALGGHMSSHNRDNHGSTGSGSGLGGQRRSHFLGSSSLSPPEPVITALTSRNNETPAAFDFDLNVMAEDVGLVDD